MSEKRVKAALGITVPILIALVSFFLLFNIVSSRAFVNGCVEQINESRDTVLKLTASSAAASTAITVLPGDIATPIADELAGLSKYFLIVLCALYLEKFIVSMSGAIACKCLIPLACGAYIIGDLARMEGARMFSRRLLAFAVALILVVPASLKLSKMVETCYEASIHQVIESAENSANQIQESIGAGREQEDAGNGLAQIIKNLQNSGDLIVNGTSQLVQYFERLLSRFVESVAIMIAVSCIIPILVILFFVWLIQVLFSENPYIDYRRMKKLHRRRERKEHNDEEVQV